VFGVDGMQIKFRDYRNPDPLDVVFILEEVLK